MSEQEVQEMSYEDAMKELESLVKQLEKGDMDLGPSLALYERAVALRKRCQTILDESERRVQSIVEEKGEASIKDFD